MTRMETSRATTAKQLRPYTRPLIKNAWYVAGWAEDFGEDLLPRRILDEPVLLYRAASGEPVAVLDVCPHKLAPMHLGQRIGDDVQCGYHGLKFNRHGVCVHNPQGNGIIPPNAKLKSYPTVERYGAVWIWMGDPAKADPQAIPDFSHIDDPKRRSVKGGHKVQCNYMMMVENLMDLGHIIFLHSQTGGLENLVLSEGKTGHEGGTITDQRLYEDIATPSLFSDHMEDRRVDFWTDIRWNAPSLIRNHAGAAPRGHARGDRSTDQLGSHFLTPETHDTTHYFYAHSRNYALDDAEGDEIWRHWQRTALKAEDSMVAEAIQGVVPQAEELGVEMVVLSTDLSGIRVNRILEEMAAAERDDG
ncbi:MAG: vanillate monooxygenase [Alphaproteobacteria bacterium]|nr:vanillate monooxygenase [Alphaproteobacteria bacterium]